MTDDPSRPTGRRALRYAVFAGAIGLGACLLFQIQFLLARQILPWFGGAPAVWSTSLVVFQTLLLAGYAWAHGLARLRSRRRQVVLQLALVAVALGLLGWRGLGWPSPVTPDATWKPQDVDSPVLAIAYLLVVAAGVPCVVLASVSPLLQRWFADLDDTTSPYRLYAISNAGSLAGLLSYPLLLEPRLDLAAQGRWWTGAFVGVTVALAGGAWLVARRGDGRRQLGLGDGGDVGEGDGPLGERALPNWDDHEAGRPSAEIAGWLLLAALPSALLQATTTRLTLDIAPVPFLWMLPLAVYLVTFIVAFEWPSACPRRGLAGLLVAGALASAVSWSTTTTLALTLLMLAVAGLALHGELARQAPPAERLTRYYLAIAAGGVAGSALVAFGAPMVFTGILEYPVGLIATLLVLAALQGLESRRLPVQSRSRARLFAEAQVLAALVLVAATLVETRTAAAETIHASRNFFSTVRVREHALPDGARYRRFVHGSTLHGVQFVDGARRQAPTSYFTGASGIGRAMTAMAARGARMRVGVIGLGIGTLAAFGRAGDSFTFFEIDPQVVALSTGANPPFTYVSDSAATIDIVVGDGRLALERSAPLALDVLAMDAFSSDAVPVHLVTREALALYARHLRDHHSLIAVNVANRYLNLAGVVAAAGAANGFDAVLVNADAAPGLVQATSWLLLSRDAETLRSYGPRLTSRDAPWTDTFSAPWRVFRW